MKTCEGFEDMWRRVKKYEEVWRNVENIKKCEKCENMRKVPGFLKKYEELLRRVKKEWCMKKCDEFDEAIKEWWIQCNVTKFKEVGWVWRLDEVRRMLKTHEGGNNVLGMWRSINKCEK